MEYQWSLGCDPIRWSLWRTLLLYPSLEPYLQYGPLVVIPTIFQLAEPREVDLLLAFLLAVY